MTLLAAGAISSAPSAQAAQSDCASGRACVWSAYDYHNDFLQGWAAWTYCFDDFNDGWNINDKGSSFYNNGNSETAYVYQYKNAGGPRISRPPKSGYKDLNTVHFNDRASSGYFSSRINDVGSFACR
ncbi:hypothetical protein LK09_10480 [Microbacterium mangrovi]|uniref:Peptidase inhibitor family I36 protein n=1 Tax=Microbacterium mangrovi TaxID=1348253 RepID=A0A0B2A2A2_9MICO|nr:hypothetical protein LK09_10480 [Microbacterium mangrovi]